MVPEMNDEGHEDHKMLSFPEDRDLHRSERLSPTSAKSNFLPFEVG
jgi:hypothetical protein